MQPADAGDEGEERLEIDEDLSSAKNHEAEATSQQRLDENARTEVVWSEWQELPQGTTSGG